MKIKRKIAALTFLTWAMPMTAAQRSEPIELGLEQVDELTSESIQLASVPVTLAYGANGFITSTGNFYFTTHQIDEFGPDSTAVWRQSKDSTGPSILLYRESSDANQFFFFGDITYANVGGNWYGYFLANYNNFDTGTKTSLIKRIPLAGGSATIIATSPAYAGGGNIKNDGTNIYWSDASGVRRVAIGGGAISTIATSASASNVGLDSNWVYFADGSTVKRVSKTGGAATIQASATSAIRTLYVDAASSGTTVYFGDANSSIMSRKIGAPTTTTYQQATPGRNARSVGFDGSHVIWSDCSNAGNACAVRYRSNGSTITIQAGLVNPHAVQWDPTHFFWAEISAIKKFSF